MKGCPVHHHGMSKAKGCGHLAPSHFSRLFDCPSLPLSEQEAAILGGPGGLMHDFDGASPDSPIPAGYIFFAQFIDHDVTLDTESSLREEPRTPEKVRELGNIRSPSLDLDCVYGFGPEASPHIYDPERPGRLAIGNEGRDLARSPGGTALIGDPRNDENLFVSQMQLLFHKFHNRIFNERHPGFEEAQRQARYHYQWLVLFDFLKRLCDPAIYAFAVPKIVACKGYPLCFKPEHLVAHKGKKVDHEHSKITMAVEFSAAAYRVGHTMVRSVYAVNNQHLDIELFDERFGTEGFSEVPEELVVDWRYLLSVCECVNPRLSKAIDTQLADEIQSMPAAVVPTNNPNDRALAFRNLLRGNALGLPSGQCVARELKKKGYPIKPLPAARFSEIPGWKRLDECGRGRADALARDTPLFFYILRESELGDHKRERLGPVGSAILLEVFGGMLLHCKDSFLKVKGKDWNPDPCISKERWGWWSDRYVEGFDRDALINRPDYYPFDLADVVRFVEGCGDPRSCGCNCKCCD